MTNSFLGHGSVQPKQCILRHNDKMKNCRTHLELSKYEKRGGRKGWQRFLEFHEYWVQPQKSGKKRNFYPRVMKIKGVAKGGAFLGVAKGEALFPNIDSDHI